jgi:TusA-related sulfurtransferase
MQIKPDSQRADYYLDITADVCPMTFVRARLLVERMAPGQTAEIRLKGEEPLANVPASLRELGHTVEALAPEISGSEVHILRIRSKS